MSDLGFQWGHEHFCVPDATQLYQSEPDRLADLGHPVALTTPPRPETFCSVCFQWFDPPHEGSDHRPPEKGHHG
ncbi:hypothetical protein SEA_BRUHMOMENT_86 [Arthrobacter phage BruhMoment]|nr:hypothetical protein SEA_BRUHMOMENT_86 [Arthrobacter phage BruhMoment]